MMNKHYGIFQEHLIVMTLVKLIISLNPTYKRVYAIIKERNFKFA